MWFLTKKQFLHSQRLTRLILKEESHVVRFIALKESHSTTSSIGFSFDYDLAVFSFTLNLSLKIIYYRILKSVTKELLAKVTASLTQMVFLNYVTPFLKWLFAAKMFSLCDCARTALWYLLLNLVFFSLPRNSCLFFLLRLLENNGEASGNCLLLFLISV